MMSLIKRISFLMGWLIIVYLSGCSSAEIIKDPNYAPAQPVVIERINHGNGAIYHASTNIFAFEDVKARRVGDSITIILQEQTNASKTASTSTKKSSDLEIPAPTLFGRGVTRNGTPILTSDMETNSEFSGEGDTSQSNSLSGNITVTVNEVLPNGNLFVKGEKILTLNQGSEVIRISGIIRPRDISPANTILSTQIAGAEITYSGNGAVASSSKPGWLTRFFNSHWWPF